jgi:hypothetical protein
LALNIDAGYGFRCRMVREAEEDWVVVAGELEKTTKKRPSNEQVAPLAQARHDQRATEEHRAAAEKTDWLRDEKWMQEKGVAHLPVDYVPQAKPKRTYISLAA